MKTIKVRVFDESDVESLIYELDNKIPESSKTSLEFLTIYPHVLSCIRDYSARSKTLPRTGTTIHLAKDFEILDLKISILLDFPKKTNFLAKMVSIFYRD